MSQKTEWKLNTPPDVEARVDADVLALRTPLVWVHRDHAGTWCFDGPGTRTRPVQNIPLGAVVDAWPHVAALGDMQPGNSVVWSWKRQGWAGEYACRCGHCEAPTPVDLDHTTWPKDLQADRVVSVEFVALSGEVGLTDIVHNPGGVTLVGPGLHRRTSDKMTPVAVANVVRRWPHTLQALQALNEGRGMRWNASTLSWHEYVIA